MSEPRVPNQNHFAEQFASLWQLEDTPPDVFEFIENNPCLTAALQVQVCLVDQIHRWRAKNELPVERYLELLPQIQTDERLKLELLKQEYACRFERGLNPTHEEFKARYPEMADLLRAALATGDLATVDPHSELGSTLPQTRLFVPDKVNNGRDSNKESRLDASINELPPPIPVSVGRYRVLRVIGDGGFGRVFLSRDDVLERDVAIKMPHRHLIAESANIESYLKEARIVSRLDHHSIVPVFDCGCTDDGLCFVVSKYINGSDLATKLKHSPLANSAAVELVACIAEALHYAHIKGVVHRDVKPANILIDSDGRPYLADFGIALREEDIGTGGTRLGTFTYMSPEQLRGEGHLVDGRSDIFSLGVVLYELITGKRPFSSKRLDMSSLSIEPRPPRQIDDSIPKELERICLRALAHRVIDRYNTATDMAADLRQFLQSGIVTNIPNSVASGLSGPSGNMTSGHQSFETGIQIVPKGLRSFDREDSGFFLELLPGTRGRDGLPECIRFWRTRILARDAETFRVGVIYGPSGSGKSSFLKAGVLPLLAGEVISVYVESTPLETESRLLKTLKKCCPGLPRDSSLIECMTFLRRERRDGTNPKVLLVLDQFEQWLHARPKGETDELLLALRQCDGIHLQCVITVRDDFWMALTHFMNELEVNLVQGNNFAVVDLFNLRHARKVLTAIGQAYGTLPTVFHEISKEQKSFINMAVDDLARDDLVIPVQLALFAEMVKDKAWTPATLKSLGGIEGVGVTFLEETFNGRAAHPYHRLHQKAARAVLQSLLSDESSGIKGAMRSYQELLEISGYTEMPQEFEVLMRILDSELRLITPTEPEGLDTGPVKNASPSNNLNRYYHLTHDYLVPSLHEWLTRKRKETRRGRAELILADRASVWNHRPSSRSLPSVFEWLVILLFAGDAAQRKNRQMLTAASQYYGGRAGILCIFLGMLFFGVQYNVHRTRASLIVESLASTRGQDIPAIIDKLKPYRDVANRMLQDHVKNSDSPTMRMHAALASLDIDSKNLAIAFEGLLNASPDDFSTICLILAKSSDKPMIAKQLWNELFNPENTSERRFRAGAALATFDVPDSNDTSANWRQMAGYLAQQLVTEIGTINPVDFGQWVSAFRPARHVLYADLHRIFAQPNSLDLDRYAAARILADFSADQPNQLADLALLAMPREYGILVPKLRLLNPQGKEALLVEFSVRTAAESSIDESNAVNKRKAYAAVALLEFDVIGPLLQVLSEADDPMLSTFAEIRLSQLGAHAEPVFRLLKTADTKLRASLMRSLAGMRFDKLSRELRDPIVKYACRLFESDPNPDAHSAAEWALRSWGLRDELAQLTRDHTSGGPLRANLWYITREGHTMVVIRGPLDIETGSPLDEKGRDASDERPSKCRINRNFAISSTEVTFAQFLTSEPNFRHQNKKDYTPTPDCPMGMVTWHRATGYCNWMSKMEGIPPDQWCYQTRGFEMQPEDDYLTRTGYRLPTEAEWEYACRAGTTSAYYWGNDPEVSPRYAWTLANSQGRSWPVGSLCPNRLGLFDMHGNVAEWLHDQYQERLPELREDIEHPEIIRENSNRVFRGGSFLDFVPYQRSANRNSSEARNGVSPRLGFRIARTLPSSATNP